MKLPSLWWVILIAIIFLTPWRINPAEAQGDQIVVKALEVTSEFPEGIRFHVDVESPTPITDITLQFRVIGHRSARYQRPEAFTPSTRVQTDFLVRTDTYDRYLPPGSDVHYFLEIKTQGGQELATEPRLFTYLDVRFDWEEVKEGNTSILYYGSGGSLARTVLDTVVLTLQDMEPLLGVNQERSIRLVVYNSASDMVDALPLASETQRRQLLTQGQTYSPQGLILLLGAPADIVRIASHEVIHILMHEAADNPLREIPVWLNEGMAEYGSRDAGSSYDRVLAIAVAEDRLIPFRQLTTRPGLAEDITLLYSEAKSFVAFLVDTFGGEKLRQMLRLLKSGRPMNEALQQTYGANLDELENQWRGSIGASLIQVFQEPQAKPTPTPVPTLPPLTLVLSTPAPASTSRSESRRGQGLSCGASPPGAALDLSAALFALGVMALVIKKRR